MTPKYEWTMLSALGGQMLEVREGYAKAILPLTEAVMQPTRVYHAGAIVTLADEAASAAIHGGPMHDAHNETGKRFPYSVQLSVNLLTNDPIGPMMAEAKVIRKGRMTVVETTVYTHDHQVAALMRSTHMMVDLKKAGPHQKAEKC